ncbi:hypothetical protein FHS90_001902 [Rufibacter quisquiliarum]|uniref:Uncharacterized protein n=1 Tax=Rufibacter quisquiliarum TaxID=1549639 RepID=A0A839GTS9_9BACT|nr:hypothetical protein [Rufibacter quisquiliarum]
MKQQCLVSQPCREGSQRPSVICRHESGDPRQREYQREYQLELEGTEVTSAP